MALPPFYRKAPGMGHIFIVSNSETLSSPNKVYMGNLVRRSGGLSDYVYVWQRNGYCDD